MTKILMIKIINEKFFFIKKMKDIKADKRIDDSPIPVSIDGTEKIISQMKNSVCKIHKENGLKGTGFFCRIKYNEFNEQNNYLYLLISNNHILEEIDIKEDKKIVISINNENEFKIIKIDNSRKIYTSEVLDITFIEIKPKIDKINNFLDIDENINKNEKFINDIYYKKSIYTLHYQKGKDIVVSYGLLLEIKDNFIYHLCYTDEGSSGAPILSLNNFKVIGIHFGKFQLNYNKGTFIKNAIYEFLKQIKGVDNNLNETYNKNKSFKTYNKMTIKYRINNEKKIKIFGDNFVDNNKNNCLIIIDDKQRDICSEYEINENEKKTKDTFEIKLIEINIINNISHIFDECSLLLSLPDISEWDTSYIKDMSYMFFGCSSLNDISDISKWNISNVENLNCIFCNCSSLKTIPDISNWDTSNIKNMNGMFYGCKLLSILPDISKWNVSNVIDMNYMFSNCSSLINIPDISKWDINKASIYGMFNGCNKLIKIPSKFN